MQTCNVATGQGVSGTCTPSCSGKTCGQDDGCGTASVKPTLSCTQPCPPGLGCIPFTVDGSGQHYPGICYPAEGCFSAPPA